MLLAFDQFKAESKSGMNFIIIGNKYWWNTEMSKVFNSLNFKSDILFTGHLDIAEMSKILGSAFALVYPSFFEGFGIPIVEAMQAEIPVITGNKTSLPEVAGEAAILIDPFSVDDISKAYTTIVTDDALRQNLINKGKKQSRKFNWDESAEKFWLSIEKTLE